MGVERQRAPLARDPLHGRTSAMLGFEAREFDFAQGSSVHETQSETEPLRPCRRAGHNLWRRSGETLQMV